jgi:hypothetical protein
MVHKLTLLCWLVQDALEEVSKNKSERFPQIYATQDFVVRGKQFCRNANAYLSCFLVRFGKISSNNCFYPPVSEYTDLSQPM